MNLAANAELGWCLKALLKVNAWNLKEEYASTTWMAMMLSIKFCVQGSGTAAAVGGLLLRKLLLSQGGNVKRINDIPQNPS